MQVRAAESLERDSSVAVMSEAASERSSVSREGSMTIS